jgi:hypothetical protein
MYKKYKGEISPDDFKSESSIEKLEKFDPSSITMKLVSDKRLMSDVSCVKIIPYGSDTTLKKKRLFTVRIEMTHIDHHGKEGKPLIKEVSFNMNVKPRPL